MLFAVHAAQSGAAIPWALGLLENRDNLAAEVIAQAENAIALYGTPEQARRAFDVVIDPATPFERAEALLGSLLTATATRGTVPAGDLSGLSQLLHTDGGPLSVRAVEAVGVWGLAGLVEPVKLLAADTSRPNWLQEAAIKALGRLPADASATALADLADRQTLAPGLRAAAIEALAAAAADTAATAATELLATTPPQPVQDRIFRGFLSRRGGGDRLADALAKGPAVPREVLIHGIALVRGAGQEQPRLMPLLESLSKGESPVPTAAMTAGDLATFAAFIAEAGDAGRGEALYRQEKLQCVKCHRIGREGGRVGPDLTAIGASSPLDYVIDSVLHPAKNVKEGYNTLVVLTADGRVVTGIPVSRTGTELVLRTAEDKVVSIRTDDIDEESPGASLMPQGLVDGLSQQELADLVRYLSQLGR